MRAFLIFMIVPMIAAAGSHCAGSAAGENDTMKSSAPWEISVATEGGLAGKGLGAVSITSAGEVTASDITRRCDGTLSAEDMKRVSALAEKAASVTWDSSYLDPSSPRGEFDQVRYTMTLKTSGGADRTTYWFDQSASRLPAELRTLFDDIWSVRQRVVDHCA